jgi:hypothetical protein
VEEFEKEIESLREAAPVENKRTQISIFQNDEEE